MHGVRDIVDHVQKSLKSQQIQLAAIFVSITQAIGLFLLPLVQTLSSYCQA